MTVIVAATNNKKKLTELCQILDSQGANVISLSEAGILTDPEETGTTFEQNAIIKAHAAALASGKIAIADDSGLEVDALDGAPGIYSARYCEGSDSDRTAFLLKNMEHVPDGKRTARFVSAIAVVTPDGEQTVVRGTCEGIIARAPQGDGGFGYDPVFYVPEENATFSQIDSERKNQISHRANALRLIAPHLQKLTK